MCGCVPCFSPWIPDSKQTLTIRLNRTTYKEPNQGSNFFWAPYHMWVKSPQESRGEHGEPIVGKRRTSECRLSTVGTKAFQEGPRHFKDKLETSTLLFTGPTVHQPRTECDK